MTETAVLIPIVTVEQLNQVWSVVEPMLAPAVDRASGETTIGQTYFEIVADHQQLWIVLDKAEQKILCALTTRLLVHPDHLEAQVYLLGGEQLQRCLKVGFHGGLMDWAIYQDATEMRCFCRPGIARYLFRDFDFKEKFEEQGKVYAVYDLTKFVSSIPRNAPEQGK